MLGKNTWKLFNNKQVDMRTKFVMNLFYIKNVYYEI